MSNWFSLDIAIGLFVIGASLFTLGHQALCAMRRHLHRHSAVSETESYRHACEQHVH
jgi:hypothetical protein